MHSLCEYSEYPLRPRRRTAASAQPVVLHADRTNPFQGSRTHRARQQHGVYSIYASVQRVGPECLSGAQFSANAQSHCGPMHV